MIVVAWQGTIGGCGAAGRAGGPVQERPPRPDTPSAPCEPLLAPYGPAPGPSARGQPGSLQSGRCPPARPPPGTGGRRLGHGRLRCRGGRGGDGGADLARPGDGTARAPALRLAFLAG